MLGRAGRPQFDDSAIAVIMTRLQRVQHYEKMVTGQELLESCLHRNLIDHLNAEIGLGTITSASTAKKWLSGTFLYVRLKANPEHYKLDGDATRRNLDESLENICTKGIAMLEESDLVKAAPKLHCTEFGDAMARYSLQFDTMRVFLALPSKAKVSEILSAISQAAEFRDIRFRAGEKPIYKDLNKSGSIKFPIPVNLDASAHKVSLIIQSVLGAVELPTENYSARIEYSSAKVTIFHTVHRLIRCIIDCSLYLDDAVTARNALTLARSLGAQVWDDSPLHMKQLESVGLVAVRKLAVAGIKSIEDMENAEAHRLEHILSRNPPYGAQLHEKARAFPKLRVSLKTMGEPMIKKGECVTVNVKAEIGFLNERVPEIFQRKAVYVCFLAETSDGHRVHFARTSAKKLNKGQDILFRANLTTASQSIRGYIMCDEIAGTARHANLKPEIPGIAFPPPKAAEPIDQQRSAHVPNISKRRASAGKARADADDASDEFGGLDDADLALAETGGFVDIDDIDDAGDAAGKPKHEKQKTAHNAQAPDDWDPQQLPNGKWACNHACKDKTACKHFCCREGLDKKPKPPKQKETKKHGAESKSDPKQTQITMPAAKKAGSLTTVRSSKEKAACRTDNSREARDLDRLHNSVTSNTPKVPIIGRGGLGHDAQSTRGQPRLSFMDAARSAEDQHASSDYGIDQWEADKFPTASGLVGIQAPTRMSSPMGMGDFNLLHEDMLEAGYAGAPESQHSQALGEGYGDGQVDLSSFTNEPANEWNQVWQLNEPYDDGYGGLQMSATPEKPEPIDDLFAVGKGKGLFVSNNSDDPAATTSTQRQTHRGDAHALGVGSSKFFAPDTAQKAPSRMSSAQRREDLERFMQPIVEEALSSNHVDGDEEQDNAGSPDEIEKWFNAEFGTEHFNYVG